MTVRSEEGTHGVRLIVLVSKCFSQLSAITKYRGWVASQHSLTFLTGGKSQMGVAVWRSSGEPFFQAAGWLLCLHGEEEPGSSVRSFL